MRATLVTARGALLAVVVFALVASVVPWHCCGHGATVGDKSRSADTTAVVAVMAHHAHACDDETAPLATAEPARSPLARPAVTATSGVPATGAGFGGVTVADPGAARGDPPSAYLLCVLRT